MTTIEFCVLVSNAMHNKNQIETAYKLKWINFGWDDFSSDIARELEVWICECARSIFKPAYSWRLLHQIKIRIFDLYIYGVSFLFFTTKKTSIRSAAHRHNNSQTKKKYRQRCKYFLQIRVKKITKFRNVFNNFFSHMRLIYEFESKKSVKCFDTKHSSMRHFFVWKVRFGIWFNLKLLNCVGLKWGSSWALSILSHFSYAFYANERDIQIERMIKSSPIPKIRCVIYICTYVVVDFIIWCWFSSV